MPGESPAEPEWVQRMRARGYNIRVGTGEPMSEEPDAAFYPPPYAIRSRFRSVGAAVSTILRNLFRPSASDSRARHAPLP